MNITNDVEIEVSLDKFNPAPWQESFWDGLFNKGYRRIFVLMSRRSGKDFSCWNAIIRKALEERIFILYCLPTFSQARRVIWDGMTFEGEKFLDFIPRKAIASLNIAMMRIELINGSMICLAGSDNFKERLVGINPKLIVFSEWARCKSEAFDFASPILAANKGTAIFLTTPYGKNHAFHMWEMAQTLPDWLCIKKTIYDTNHIDPDELLKEQQRMSPELYAQEYLCSFNRGIEGGVFTRELNSIRDKEQITTVEWSPDHDVNVAIDIGVRDATALTFFQVIGNGTIIRVIDFEAFTGEGLNKLAALIQSKPYKYNKFFAPHDLEVREWTRGGMTRTQIAAQLGLNFHVLPKLLIQDSIELSRMAFPKIWIDSRKCSRLVDALENYHREWDEERQCYRGNPVHDWSSDFCDSFRYMCQSLDLCQKGMSPDDFNKIRNQALYGRMNTLPNQFRSPF